MFNYPGSKYYLAKRYPPPFYDTIIEPFAGSAQYSFLHWRKNVTLIDLNPDVVDLWRRLQRATPEEVLALPTFGDSELIVHEDPAWRFLMVLGLKRGDINGRNAGTGAWLRSWPAKRRKVADGLDKVRHWEIIQGDYTAAPDMRATWFIDPPYQYGLTYSCPRLDYFDLAEWVLTRRGQTIVCEQPGAAWLPFEPLYAPDLANGSRRQMANSGEVVFHRHNFKRGGPPLPMVGEAWGDVPPTYGHGRFWP